ncbi:MAG: D-alanyl-D-alanine carboxypeptidase family protein [Fusobacteriaceae bacterium]
MKKILLGMLIIGATVFPATKTVKTKISKTKTAHEQVDNRPDYHAYLVGDREGNVYFSENMHELRPLASVTKVMTMLLTFEAVDRGDVSLEDEVEIHWNAARQGGSMIPLKVGQKFKLKDLVMASGVHSANNATYAVAEYVGKGYDNFIKMMNDKAKELGLEGEMKFYTPAGLPTRMTKEGMDVASAYGVYKLSLEAAKHQEYLDIAKLKNPKIDEDKIQLRNKNLLLGKQGVIGLKTGYHGNSGFNVSIISELSNLRTHYVVMGGKTQKIRDNKILELIDKFNKEYKNIEILSANKSIMSIPVEKGTTTSTSVYPEKDFSFVSNEENDIKVETENIKKLIAPIAINTEVGNYKVISNGKIIDSGKLLTKESIEKKGFFENLMDRF